MSSDQPGEGSVKSLKSVKNGLEKRLYLKNLWALLFKWPYFRKHKTYTLTK